MWNDTDFNSTFSSPSAGAKEVKKNLIKHIVPVTAQIINTCNQVEGENSVYEMGPINFHQVSFIGIIRNVIKRANDTTYLVDDMTSTEINVKLQSDDPDDMESEEARPTQIQFMENQYIKVFGIIKSLQGEKIVQAFRILPIKELNEVTHHILECMNASVHYHTKGGEDMQMNNGSENTNQNQNNGNSGLDSLHSQLSSLIKNCNSSQGMHIKEICGYLKSFSEEKIRDTLEFLSTEGHVYSTIDDEHFKSTEQM
jgi:replication factor A2